MKRAQDWAIRITHEAQYHEQNCFITLTFSDQELARRQNPGSVDTTDTQKFIKRLRNHIKRKEDNRPIRYFAVGEYGEETGRPHYHILIFGWEPSDGTLFKTSRKGSTLYNSQILSNLWTHGYINYGSLTWDSAAYCAGYITKKFNQSQCENRLTWVDPLTNEIRPKEPEYANMSLKPAIGHQWITDNLLDAYNNDYVVIKQKKRALPRYYDTVLERSHPEWMAQIKDKRQLEFLELPHISEDRRLDIHLCRWEHHSKRLRETGEHYGNTDIHDLRQQSESIPKAILHAKRRYRYADDNGNH